MVFSISGEGATVLDIKRDSGDFYTKGARLLNSGAGPLMGQRIHNDINPEFRIVNS